MLPSPGIVRSWGLIRRFKPIEFDAFKNEAVTNCHGLKNKAHEWEEEISWLQIVVN